MHAEAILGAAIGAGVLASSIAGASRPKIPGLERRAFRAINRSRAVTTTTGAATGSGPVRKSARRDVGCIVLWLPMQFGNLVVGTAAGLVVAWRAESWPAAGAVAFAALLKLVVERLLRRWLRPLLTVRQRPGTSEPGAVLRGADVPERGPSFPSGHAILAAAIACVIASEVPDAWTWVPFALTALVMYGRVYVGAHNPLDVTAGLGLGLLVGAIVTDLFV